MWKDIVRCIITKLFSLKLIYISRYDQFQFLTWFSKGYYKRGNNYLLSLDSFDFKQSLWIVMIGLIWVKRDRAHASSDILQTGDHSWVLIYWTMLETKDRTHFTKDLGHFWLGYIRISRKLWDTCNWVHWSATTTFKISTRCYGSHFYT